MAVPPQILARIMAARDQIAECRSADEKRDISRLHALSIMDYTAKQPNDAFDAVVAGDLAPKIHAVDFEKSDRALIIDAVTKKLGKKLAKRRDMQDYTAMIEYITHEELDAMTAYGKNSASVLSLIHELMLTFGCVNPS